MEDLQPSTPPPAPQAPRRATMDINIEVDYPGVLWVLQQGIGGLLLHTQDYQVIGFAPSEATAEHGDTRYVITVRRQAGAP